MQEVEDPTRPAGSPPKPRRHRRPGPVASLSRARRREVGSARSTPASSSPQQRQLDSLFDDPVAGPVDVGLQLGCLADILSPPAITGGSSPERVDPSAEPPYDIDAVSAAAAPQNGSPGMSPARCLDRTARGLTHVHNHRDEIPESILSCPDREIRSLLASLADGVFRSAEDVVSVAPRRCRREQKDDVVLIQDLGGDLRAQLRDRLAGTVDPDPPIPPSAVRAVFKAYGYPARP